MLSFGIAGSLGVAWWGGVLAARRSGIATRRGFPTTAWLSTGLLSVVLWAIAAWMVFQPMDMRGTAGFAS